MDESYVPTQAEMWRFIVEFAEATQTSFARLEKKIDDMALGIATRLDRIENRLDRVEQRLDRVEERLYRVELRLDRVEAHLTRIEGWNILMRFDDHERRLTRLEHLGPCT